MAKILLLILLLEFNLLKPLFGNGKIFFWPAASEKNRGYLNLNHYHNLKLVVKEKEKLTKPRSTIKLFRTVKPSPDLKKMFFKYGRKYGVKGEILQKIAYCESTFNPRAVNGHYAGMYQFLSATWVSNRKAMGLDSNPDLRFNAEEAIKTTAYKIARDGTGAWPVCGR